MPTQNPLVQLASRFDAVVPLLLEAFEGDAARQERVRETAAKLRKDADSSQLRTLVFGYYNAGKSTFINALLGEERAPMGDVPVTASITDYAWEGHLLSDSPGIDAPIDHEEITDEFIRKECHAVVFVLPFGGAIEEAATWDRLCSFIQQKKAVLVVVNDKRAHDLNGADFLRVQQAVFANLQQAAGRLGLEQAIEKIEVLHVKAKTALNGKLANKPPLVASSGIAEVEASLRRFLSASIATMAAANREQARGLVSDAQDRLARESGAKAGQLQACRRAVADQQALLHASLAEAAEALVAQELKAVKGVVESLHGPLQDVTTQLENEMVRSQSRLQIGIARSMRSEIERAQEEVDKATAGLEDELGLGEADAPKVELKGGELPKGRGGARKAAGKIGADLLGSLKKLPTEEWTRLGAESVLHAGKKHLPDLFRGIGKKTIEKWSATVGKVAGPAIIIATAAYDIWNAGSADREARKEHQSFIEAVMKEVRRTFELTKEECGEFLDEAVRGMFAPLLADLDESLKEALAADAATTARLAQLGRWDAQAL